MITGNRKFTIVSAIVIVLLFDVLFQRIADQIAQTFVNVEHGYLLSAISVQSVMFGFAMVLTALFVGQGFLKSILFREDRKPFGKYVVGFGLIWPLLLALTYGLVILLDNPTWVSLTLQPIPSQGTVLSTLFFQSLFPGLGEEPLYRGFLIVLLLGNFWDGRENPSDKHIWRVILLSAVIFSIAHLSYGFSPFRVTFDSYQLLTALVLGGFQAWVFVKTRNLWGSIWIHNLANVTMSVFVWVIAIVF